jgi:hypothetical protein
MRSRRRRFACCEALWRSWPCSSYAGVVIGIWTGRWRWIAPRAGLGRGCTRASLDASGSAATISPRPIPSAPIVAPSVTPPRPAPAPPRGDAAHDSGHSRARAAGCAFGARSRRGGLVQPPMPRAPSARRPPAATAAASRTPSLAVGGRRSGSKRDSPSAAVAAVPAPPAGAIAAEARPRDKASSRRWRPSIRSLRIDRR